MSSEHKKTLPPAQIVHLARRHIARILKWTQTLDEDSYMADEMVRFAVERAFISLGEAIKDLTRSVDLLSLDPRGPWRDPARFRDFLAHSYDDQIVPALVWDTVRYGVPDLDAALARVEPLVGGPFDPDA